MSVFDTLDGDGLEEVERILLQAHEAAEQHIALCLAAEMDGGEYPDNMNGPFCGCLTCEVRETLHAALPKIEEAILVAWGLGRNAAGAGT